MRILRRLLSPSMFTLVGLCFLLPFATVTYVSGCGDYVGGTTTFTGIQLVTRAVSPATGVSDGEDLSTARDVQHRGSLSAEGALLAVAVGFVLGLLGIAAGPGWCAAVGLTALLQVYFSLSHGDWNEGFQWTAHPGFVLALFLFAAVGSLHLNRWWERRGLSWSRRGYWVGVAAGSLGLSILIFAALFAYGLGFAIAAVSIGVALYHYLRRRKEGVRRGATYWEHVVVGTLAIYGSVAIAVAAHALWIVPLLWAGVLTLVRLSRRHMQTPGRASMP